MRISDLSSDVCSSDLSEGEGQGSCRGKASGVIACLIMLAAASTAAQSSATQIAQATFQPERAIADALAQWDAQFDAGVTRASVGRTMTADQEARKNRAKAAGKAELSQQLRTTGIPKMLHLNEADYIQNFPEEELREAAKN